MDAQKLADTAKTLIAANKGLLAMDESTPTCDKRFAKLGISQTTPFVKVLTDAGMIPAIKADASAKAMAGHVGEKITEGLDGLRERLTEYAAMGARFAKWRAVIAVGEDIPSCDRQLIDGLAGLLANTITRRSIAYEPVWAIGNTGRHATPQQAGEAHAVIRRRFARLFGEESAQRLVIQYGGSVKPGNAAAMLAQPGVDGALIGGASLDAGQFLALVQAGIGDPQSEGKAA